MPDQLSKSSHTRALYSCSVGMYAWSIKSMGEKPVRVTCGLEFDKHKLAENWLRATLMRPALFKGQILGTVERRYNMLRVSYIPFYGMNLLLPDLYWILPMKHITFVYDVCRRHCDTLSASWVTREPVELSSVVGPLRSLAKVLYRCVRLRLSTLWQSRIYHAE